MEMHNKNIIYNNRKNNNNYTLSKQLIGTKVNIDINKSNTIFKYLNKSSDDIKLNNHSKKIDFIF